LENHLAVQLYNSAATLGSTVLQVLDAWGEQGRSRDELLAKAEAIASENHRIDRQEMDRQRQKSDEQQTKARAKPKGPRT
jgi:hypothetical protein